MSKQEITDFAVGMKVREVDTKIEGEIVYINYEHSYLIYIYDEGKGIWKKTQHFSELEIIDKKLPLPTGYTSVELSDSTYLCKGNEEIIKVVSERVNPISTAGIRMISSKLLEEIEINLAKFTFYQNILIDREEEGK